MRGFITFLLMVMMVCLMVAPMTGMAHDGTGGAPVLAIAMEHWSDIMTAKERAGPKSEPVLTKETLIVIDYNDMFIGITASEMTTISGMAQATDGKAGGGAILPLC